MKNLPALVICYRRPHYLRQLLESLTENSPSAVYISIDAARDGDPKELLLVEECKNIAKEYRSISNFPVRILHRERNLGSAINVITSIDWFFSFEEEGAILEEDCIPSNTFLDYVKKSLFAIKNIEKILIVSGTRPLTRTRLPDGLLLTHLPLNWGWGTSRIKWEIIKDLIINLSSNYKIREIPFMKPTEMFLYIGGLRGLRGWTDVWDTILASSMLKHNYLTLIPPKNMISNIGVDSLGLNTKAGDPQLLRAASEYCSPMEIEVPITNRISVAKIDKIIYEEVIGIGKKHLIFPPLKFIAQKVLRWNRGRGSLAERLGRANV